MADLEEGCTTLLDTSRGACFGTMARTITHGALVTVLFFVIMFAYIYLYLIVSNAVALLVIEVLAYLAVVCLYICNSSGWMEKILSAGFLVLVLSVFLISSIGLDSDNLRVNFVSCTNIVAICSYCIWKFYPAVLAWLYCRLTKRWRAILHGATVAILLSVIMSTYLVGWIQGWPEILLLIIQLLAYHSVGCLYICNSSDRKEKIISSGFLVLVLSVFLVCSVIIQARVGFIFGANIVAISMYCVWKLLVLYAAYNSIRRRLPAPPGAAAAAAGARRQPPRPTTFRIQELPREFSGDEIRAMTQDFGIMVGEGGYAQVFRGKLDDGTAVAVKWIKITNAQAGAGEAQFRQEVSIVASVHHRNLVRLLGYSLPRGGGRFLVYPFFENGSLDSWLFHRGPLAEERRRLLTWPKRRCIAVDVAMGLAYLHHHCHRQILHLDVKPANILLDGDLRAHVSDFGISMSITRDASGVYTRPRGTPGYMPPEMLGHRLSAKSDVFSYGVTVLELVGGRKNYRNPTADASPDMNRDYFPYIVRDKIARGELMDVVGGAMDGLVDNEDDVELLVRVALHCIQGDPEQRPTMQIVVDMLQRRVALADLPPDSRRQPPVNLWAEVISSSSHTVGENH